MNSHLRIISSTFQNTTMEVILILACLIITIPASVLALHQDTELEELIVTFPEWQRGFPILNPITAVLEWNNVDDHYYLPSPAPLQRLTYLYKKDPVNYKKRQGGGREEDNRDCIQLVNSRGYALLMDDVNGHVTATSNANDPSSK